MANDLEAQRASMIANLEEQDRLLWDRAGLLRETNRRVGSGAKEIREVSGPQRISMLSLDPDPASD